MPLPYINPVSFRTPDFNEDEERKRRALQQGARPLPTPGNSQPVAPRGAPQIPPIVLPGGGDQPPLTGVEYTPSLPNVAPLARPAPLTGPMQPPMEAPRTIAPTGPPPLSDYRGRQIQDAEDFERDQFMRKGATTDESGNLKFKRSLKGSLIGAGLGALRGLATGQGLGAGLGGAITGAAVPLINPRLGREAQFEATQAPMIRAQQQRAQQQQEAERKQRLGDLQIENLKAETELRKSQALKAAAPPLARQQRHVPAWRTVIGDDGQPAMVDLNAPENAEKTFRPFQKPTTTREPSLTERQRQADLEQTRDEGAPEKIAMDSTNARRPDVIASAPAGIREILQSGGKKRADGKAPTAQEIEKARTWFNKEMGRIYKENLEFTKAKRRQNVATQATGRAPLAQPPASKAQPTAQRKAVIGANFVNHVAKSLNISAEEARRRIIADGYEVR